MVAAALFVTIQPQFTALSCRQKPAKVGAKTKILALCKTKTKTEMYAQSNYWGACLGLKTPRGGGVFVPDTPHYFYLAYISAFVQFL